LSCSTRPRISASTIPGTGQPAFNRLPLKICLREFAWLDPGRCSCPAQPLARLCDEWPDCRPNCRLLPLRQDLLWNQNAHTQFQQSHHPVCASTARIPEECLHTIRNARRDACQGVRRPSVVSFQPSVHRQNPRGNPKLATNGHLITDH